MDDSGACIFHSHAIAWKRENHFKERFLQLVELLDADETWKCYDFAEFEFIGNELRTENHADHYALQIADTTFRKRAYFTGASFLDSLELDGVDFQNGATFRKVIFAHDLRIKDARFRGLDFIEAKLTHRAFFIKVDFLDFALFERVRFTGTTSGYVVKFEDSRFQGITDFSGAAFVLGDESSVAFLKARFEDFADFQKTQFHCGVVFNDVSFASVTEFIDTSFDTVNHPNRTLPSGRVTPSVAAVLYFMCLGASLFSTRHFVDARIAFWYYALITLSISYGYVVEALPGIKAPYVATLIAIPVLIVAASYPAEGRLRAVAGSVFAFAIGREICMDILDRVGDVTSFMHRLRPGLLAMLAFTFQIGGLALLLMWTVIRTADVAALTRAGRGQ